MCSGVGKGAEPSTSGCSRWTKSHIPQKWPEVLRISKRTLGLLRSLLRSFKLLFENNDVSEAEPRRPSSPLPPDTHIQAMAGQDRARSAQLPGQGETGPSDHQCLCMARLCWGMALEPLPLTPSTKVLL